MAKVFRKLQLSMKLFPLTLCFHEGLHIGSFIWFMSSQPSCIRYSGFRRERIVWNWQDVCHPTKDYVKYIALNYTCNYLLIIIQNYFVAWPQPLPLFTVDHEQRSVFCGVLRFFKWFGCCQTVYGIPSQVAGEKRHIKGRVISPTRTTTLHQNTVLEGWVNTDLYQIWRVFSHTICGTLAPINTTF